MPTRRSAALGLAAGACTSFAAAAPRVITFAAPDGRQLYGDLYGRGQRGVVLAHGGRWTGANWATQAQTLAQAGLQVLAFDFRGFGRSRVEGATSQNPPFYQDVLGAGAELRRRGARSIAVIGASFGGGAAAEASVQGPGQIDKLILIAHSAIARPEAMTGDKLFILARDDPEGSGALRLVRIRDQFDRAPEPKKLVLLDGAAHAQAIFGTPQGAQLMSEILAFLRA